MTGTVEAVAQTHELTPVVPHRRSWMLIVIAALALILYRAVLVKLFLDWWNLPDFSHGFFVPLFSAFLVYRDRERLAAIPKKPTWTGLVFVALAMSVLVIGVLGAELFLSRISGLILLTGIILTFWGWARLKALVFPLAFLLLGIPIPELVFSQITFPLQLLASRLAAALLPLLQVPVFREGNVIHLPAMPLEVAEACSGIRSLLSLGTLAIIYGALLEKFRLKRVILALASIPIAVASNAIRIVGTGLCVQYWDPDKALGFFHEFSGWVVFLFSLAMLYATHKLLSLPGKRKELA
jgi:exosortase